MSASCHKPVVILGAGGHAKVVVDALVSAGREIIGVVACDSASDNSFCGYDILGNDEIVANVSPDDIELANGVGSLPGHNVRWKLASQYRARGFRFTNVIHSSAIIASEVKVSDGVQIMSGAVVQTGSVLGQDSIINTGAILDHDCIVGANCHLATGVTCSGGVDFGENVHVGTGTSIIQSISIGSNSVIAAGSVVYEDIPSDIVYIQSKKSYINTRQ